MHPRNDPFLIRARAHYGWTIGQMRGLYFGDLALLVRLFVLDRYIYCEKPTYAYEIAWVFQRDRGTIGNVLENLEAAGEVVRLDPVPRERRTFYRPKKEHVDDWFESEKRDQLETDEMALWHRRIHADNCPCLQLLSGHAREDTEHL